MTGIYQNTLETMHLGSRENSLGAGWESHNEVLTEGLQLLVERQRRRHVVLVVASC